ncbi:MAG: pseudouridine synthase [Saprospiraceae bacterium]
MATYIIYKPFNMLSQFTREAPHHVTLADLAFNFSKNVYPVGRLDADSEGLLILTDDKSLNAKLLNPKNKAPKTYWVQVEGVPTEKDLQPLKKGLTIKIKKKIHHTAPAKASLLPETPNLPPRTPPIRFRKAIPTTWISLTITEGKNRQVRRMCAAIGFPVLRLVRVGLAGSWYGKGLLEDMNTGDVLVLDL